MSLSCYHYSLGVQHLRAYWIPEPRLTQCAPYESEVLSLTPSAARIVLLNCPRHALAPNLLVGKLERCPHCGKWAIVPRAAPADLVAAEARLRADNQEGVMQVEESEEEKLKRELEESRFEE